MDRIDRLVALFVVCAPRCKTVSDAANQADYVLCLLEQLETDRKPSVSGFTKDSLLSSLPLRNRVVNCLASSKIFTIRDIFEFVGLGGCLRDLKNFGELSNNEVVSCLSDAGFPINAARRTTR
jgi:hypothetical protein